MKANGRFFGFTFVLKAVLGLIAGLILWGVCSLTNGAIPGIIVCSLIFMAIAVYLNLFIVRRAKLKTLYFLFGSIVNALFYALITVLVTVL